MPKKTPKRKAHEKAFRALRTYIRQRDKDRCQKCNKAVHGGDSQPSHVIPVGRCRRLEFDPLNVKLLCMHCHLYWWHKHPLEAAEWFRERFPDRAEYLDAMRVAVDSWTSESITVAWYEAKEMELLDLIENI